MYKERKEGRKGWRRREGGRKESQSLKTNSKLGKIFGILLKIKGQCFLYAISSYKSKRKNTNNAIKNKQDE